MKIDIKVIWGLMFLFVTGYYLLYGYIYAKLYGCIDLKVMAVSYLVAFGLLHGSYLAVSGILGNRGTKSQVVRK